MDTTVSSVLVQGVQKMFGTGEHSDLVLQCADGKEFKVHKLIVCAGSQFFSNACKPDTFKESYQNRIKLSYGHSSLIEQMLSYLYHYDLETILEYEHNKGLACLRLYELSNFYMIPSLLDTTLRAFMSNLGDDFVKEPQVATQVFLNNLKWCYEEEAYTGTPVSVRPVLIDCLVSQLPVFRAQPGVEEHMAAIFNECGQLSADFAIAMAKSWGLFTQSQCRQCQAVWAAPQPADILQLKCAFCRRRNYRRPHLEDCVGHGRRLNGTPQSTDRGVGRTLTERLLERRRISLANNGDAENSG